MPREPDLPPYVKGLFVTDPAELNPAVVNNVETLCNVPGIVLRGADWFRSVGTKDSPGTMVFTLTGDVERPGIYELPMGTSLRTMIENYGGGVTSGRPLKAIFSGVSNAVIMPSAFDTPLDFGSMQGIGSGIGSGGFIIYDDSNCVVQIAYRFCEFLFVESCFQCIACKSGTNQATSALRRLIDGTGSGADVELALAGARSAPRANRCYLPVEASLLIPSIVLNFLPEFVRHYGRGCKGCREIVTPKLADFDESTGRFTYAKTTAAADVAGWFG